MSKWAAEVDAHGHRENAERGGKERELRERVGRSPIAPNELALQYVKIGYNVFRGQQRLGLCALTIAVDLHQIMSK